MLPLEILIPSLVLNLIYVILKLIESRDRYVILYNKLTKSKSQLEKSISDYKKSISLNEIHDETLENIENFIDVMEDLNQVINFKNIY
jgi:hypothetical protein